MPVVVVALCVSPALAGVHLLETSADTWFEQRSPAAVWGAEKTLQVQAQPADNMHGAVWFDLSSIPPRATILRATLSLTVLSPDTTGAPVGLYRMTGGWDETSTWATSGNAYAIPEYGWLPGSTIGPASADITSLVRGWVDGTWPNYGVMLRASSDSPAIVYASRELDDGTPAPTLLVQTADPPPGMRVATGWYDGDATSNRSITGLGFSPDVVIVKGVAGQPAVIKTATLPVNRSKHLGAATAASSGWIDTLEPDGFTVDNGTEVNAVGSRYDWVAFKAAAGEMAIGSYTGNGVDARPITGLGLEPSYVVVFTEQASQAVQRFADEPLDEAQSFGYSSGTPNWIESFLADGFTVGNSAETNLAGGDIYHFVAFAKSTTSLSQTHVGTGFGTDVTGVGFQPDAVFMKQRWNLQPAVFRLSSWSNDVTGYFPAGGYFPGAITAMLGDGFRLGTDPSVNSAGLEHYWTAFADAGPATPTVDVSLGLSTNNNTPWPGDPVAVVLTATNNGPGTASGLQITDLLPPGMSYDTHVLSQGSYDPLTGAWDIGTLTSGQAAGLSINAIIDPGTYGWSIVDEAKITALSEVDTTVANNSASISFDVQSKQYHMATGAYTGSGGATRAITGLGFSPDVVLVRSAGNSYTVASTSTMPAGAARELGASTGLVYGAVASLDNDGFTVGASPGVNAAGATYYWSAFCAGPGVMAVGRYTGNNVDDRPVNGIGFRPAYAMILGETNQHAVHRFPGQSGDASELMTSANAVPDRIQAFLADGLELGRHAQVNAQGVTYHYVAFADGDPRTAGGIYVGDGSDNRLIGGAGFRPEYLIVSRDEMGSANVQRFAAQVTDSTVFVPGGSPLANSLQSFTADGFQVGSDATVNNSGSLYHWTGFDADVNVLPLDVDLGVSVAYDRLIANEGDTVTVSVRVSNNGTTPALGVAVVDSLMAGLELVGANPGAGSYDGATGVWTLGSLGASLSELLELRARVGVGTGGQRIPNRAEIISGNSGDLDPSNDADSDTLTVAIPVVLVDEPGSLYPASAFPGDPGLALRIDVDNLSPVGVILDTTSTVTFSDGAVVYSARLGNPTFVPASAGGFTLAFRATQVPASIAAGAAYDLTLALVGITEESAPYSQSFSTSGRNSVWIDQRMVRVEATLIGDDTVRPGARDVALLAMNVLNGHAGARTLDSLFVTDISAGVGSTAQLDGSFERLSLYADLDNSATVSAGDTLLSTAAFGAGRAAFGGNDWRVGGNAGGALLVTADIDSSAAHDGDLLDAAVLGAADVRFVEPTTVDPSISPLDPVNSYGVARVDGMAAHQVGWIVDMDSLYSGTTDQVIGRLHVPPNGYTGDVFEGFEMLDISGGFDPSDFTAVRLYRDTGDAAFDPAADALVGAMAYTGDRYVISGFSQPVDILGQIFWVTADVALTPGNGDTFRPAIPVGGIRMSSGNDGPNDRAVIRNNFHTIVAVEKVDVAAQPLPGRVTRPGNADVPLLSVVVQNNMLSPITLDSMTVANVTRGTGSQAELDGNMSALHVYRDSGDGKVDFRDALLGTGTLAGGRVTLATALALTPGEAATLLVVCDVDSLCAADGDTLALAVAGPADLHFAAPRPVTGSFPLFSDAGAVVNGMLSFQLEVYPSADSLIITTPDGNLVFDFGIPGNAYRSDVLNMLTLRNLGTASSEHIKRLTLYADGGDGTFDGGAADDAWLGELLELPLPGYYRLPSMVVPLPAGCGNLQRFFVAADLNSGATTGATIQFAVPQMGVQVASDNDGPIDLAVVDPTLKLIPKPDELTVFPYPVGDKSVHPGEKNLLNFGVGFYNGFDTPVVLTSMQLVQLGQVISTEIERVRAYADSDSNGLFSPPGDRLIATVVPTDNSYQLDGLDLELGEKRISYLFVTYDLPLVVRDSVDVDMQLNSGNDLGFKTEAVSVRGQFPLNSPGVDETDGMIADQIALHPVPDTRVPPGDINVLGLDITIPPNGYLGDQLSFLSIQNEGTAVAGQDISLLGLWVDDNGNGRFDPASDRLLSTLNWIGAEWRNPVALAETIGDGGLRCFVTANIAPTANDDRTLKLFVPLDGIQVGLSANDGPVDRELRNPGVQTISTDPLLTSLAFDRTAYSTGQTVVVTMTARNVGPDTLRAVHPGLLTASGTGSLVPVSGPIPGSVDISPGGEQDYTWTYLAGAAGDVEFCGSAFDADSTETSVETCTGTAQVQNPPVAIALTLTDIAPPGANAGQQDVQAIRVALDYPGDDSLAAAAVVSGIDLEIADGSGAPVSPGAFLENVTVVSSTGSNFPFAVSDSLTSPLRLTFATPIDLGPGDAIEMDVELDLSSAATLAPIRLGLADTAAVRVLDANSGGGAPLATGATFPWLTGAIDITAPAESLLVATLDTTTTSVNVAQENIVLFSGSLTHTGPAAAADELLTRLALTFTDESGAAVPPGDAIRRLSIHSGTSTLYFTEAIPSTGNRMDCNLSSALLLPALATLPVEVRVDARSFPVAAGLRAAIETSGDVEARDNHSDAIVAVAPQNGAFPLLSRRILFQQPATGLSVACTSLAPETILPGQADVPLLALEFTHPDTTGSNVALDSLVLEFSLPGGGPVPPGDYFSQLTIVSDTDTLAQVSSLSGITPFVECRISPPIVLSPSQAATATVLVNAKQVFSPTQFLVRVEKEYVYAVDQNDGSRILGIDGTFPLSSNAAWLRLPGDNASVAMVSRLPGNVTGGETGMAAFDLVVGNGSAPGHTAAELRGLRVTFENDSGSPVSSASLAAAARLVRSDTLIAAGTLSGTEISFVVSPGAVSVGPQEFDTLTVLLDLAAAGGATFALAVRDTGDVDIVDAETGAPSLITGAFPLHTGTTHVLSTDLASSFTNYPNPFPAGRGSTRITFYLDEPAFVSLKLYTLWGAKVKTIIDNAQLGPGLYQDQEWDGLNGSGDVVANGVYYLVLEVNPAGGGEQKIKRKVGVVR